MFFGKDAMEKHSLKQELQQWKFISGVLLLTLVLFVYGLNARNDRMCNEARQYYSCVLDSIEDGESQSEAFKGCKLDDVEPPDYSPY